MLIRRVDGAGKSQSQAAPSLILSTLPLLFHFGNFAEDDGDGDGDDSNRTGRQERPSHYKRTRKRVVDIFEELGPHYVRRAYRMNEQSFWNLLRLLKKYLRGTVLPREGSTKKHKNGAKNGLIKPSIRLSVAIRFFAGGRPEDISLVHGISHIEVFRCVSLVIDAVNQCPQLGFSYPEDHNKQLKIAAGFRDRSRQGFDICCGAIDGMLLWIERPTLKDCQQAKCGTKKFFCGRKKRFGLNLQAICVE